MIRSASVGVLARDGCCSSGSSRSRSPIRMLLVSALMVVVLCFPAAGVASMPVLLDCDPCISRKKYTLKAILHGTSNSSQWQQAQAAMIQAAKDMGVQLEIQLPSSYNAFAMAQEITASAASGQYDALIVTIPHPWVQTAIASAISKHGTPFFGLNLGYEVARDLGVIGFAAQDEYRAGKAAAEEFLRITAASAASTGISKAIFVQTDGNDGGQDDRFLGFQDALNSAAAKAAAAAAAAAASLEETTTTTTSAPNNTTNSTRQQTGGNKIQIDFAAVAPLQQFDHVTAFQTIFDDCEYDAVLIGSVASLDVAVSLWESNECQGRSIIGSFEDTSELMAYIVSGEVAFGVSPQQYLQAALPVYFAAIYATTGKALALPLDEQVYLSGPTIINRDNVPTDTIQQCAEDAFPVCPNELAPTGDEASECDCTDRSVIRLGGVLHGVTTDTFWDPVFASAEQAAADMGIDLDLERFGPRDTNEDVYIQMAARIRTLCDSGVDGIFVTIPSPIVLEAIQQCQTFDIPVISVNAGGDLSVEMGLMNHIGMLEYSAGFGAGERLLEAGMQRGHCLDHEPGNVVTATRCQGFADAIAMQGGSVIYAGKVDVPLDNAVGYKLAVDGAVGSEGDWAGEGLLMLGTSSARTYQDVLAQDHPKAVVGTFDLSSQIQDGLESGSIQFAIDQQSYMQGNMPVILLALAVQTKQSLKNHFIESGPSFIETPQSRETKVCEANFYEICPDRPAEEMHYISPALTGIGYALFSLLAIGATCCSAWTYHFRNKWVVKISQPFFLHIILFGVILSSLSIPFLGVETGYRTFQDPTTGQLTTIDNPDISLADASCMLVPWFYALGFGVTFSAIFAKIQRVKLIYLAGINMQRKTVTMKDVLNIMVIMMGIEFALLLSWQLTSPYQWERTVTEEDDGYPVKSFGVCDSDIGSYFWVGIIAFHIVCLIYALVLAWQTREINNEYAESSYLFLTVMFMFQIQCLSVPILALVRDLPDVFYFVQAIAVFSQNLTILLLIFGPKMYKIFNGEADPSGGNVANRMNLRTSLSRPPERRSGTIAQPGTEGALFLQAITESDASGGEGEGGIQAVSEDSGSAAFKTPGIAVPWTTNTTHDTSISRNSAFGRVEPSSRKIETEAPPKRRNSARSGRTDSYTHSTDLWTAQESPPSGPETLDLDEVFTLESLNESVQDDGEY